MDATTLVRVAETASVDDSLRLIVKCESSGEHFVCIFSRDTAVVFEPVQWSRFKGAVLAVDRAIAELRANGLIFDFRDEPLPEPQIPEQPGSQTVVVHRSHGMFIVEKLTAAGLVRKECRTLAEIEQFAQG